LVSGRSYYFALKSVEFGNVLGWLACLSTLAAGLWLMRRRAEQNRWLWFVFVVMGFGLIVPNFLIAVSGLRRCTILLFGFYTLLTFIVKAAREQTLPARIGPAMAFGPLAALLLHHAIAFPGVLHDLHQEASIDRAAWWLRPGGSPERSLALLV